jgi:pimeloyl-ACP methyl ester carboxylesterase
MPKTPVLAKKEHLNKDYLYIPNSDQPNRFLPEYVEADYLENYVNRASSVLSFLKKQNWVSFEKLVVAGHSQGTKIATKIAVQNHGVTHLGLFSPNPFGRIDQYVREARLNAQLGKISWGKADSLMNETYEFYHQIHNEDSLKINPNLKAWKSFNETYYDDWLTLNIPIYLVYGTEDRSADLCDMVPLFFIEKDQNNLTLKRYIGLEHNFFEVSENGRANHEKGHWEEVMQGFVKWIN